MVIDQGRTLFKGGFRMCLHLEFRSISWFIFQVMVVAYMQFVLAGLATPVVYFHNKLKCIIHIISESVKIYLIEKRD